MFRRSRRCELVSDAIEIRLARIKLQGHSVQRLRVEPQITSGLQRRHETEHRETTTPANEVDRHAPICPTPARSGRPPSDPANAAPEPHSVAITTLRAAQPQPRVRPRRPPAHSPLRRRADSSSTASWSGPPPSGWILGTPFGPLVEALPAERRGALERRLPAREPDGA